MVGLARSAIDTRDPEAARRAFEPMVPRLAFGRADPAEFRVQLRFDAAPSFTVIEYAFSAVGASVAGADDLVVISAKGRGFDLRHGRTAVDTSLPYLQAPEGLAARWNAVAARAIMLDRGSVAAVARAITGDPGAELGFVTVAPRSPELGRHWERIAHRVRQAMLTAPEAFAEPIVAGAAFNRLAMAYLYAFEVVTLDLEGRRTSFGARSDIVRAAVDHMHAHAAEPITVEGVAAALHITVRGLHAAFAAELGQSPSEHLRGIRLAGVRDELRFAPPEQGIAAVARRWGFVHLSRFAESYARQFGELPSETVGARRRAVTTAA
ncbi:helix-turn-helix transcriptional regulator [Agromyces kandeliae]|uniref:Helix-turn-helix domain-containing protein n=1 Tax=Agromyces kandeliae TaxID=2666141 RepID=A0A6L5R352_9MICO|nr:helix-turn-helix transcriptional regulator [Agromyces kandeliae]MRX44420.1 helix-turn-helix domain-containing protein [Agromyces kandeliae]